MSGPGHAKREPAAGTAGPSVDPKDTERQLRVQPRLEVGRSDDPAEREADQMAAQVMAALADPLAAFDPSAGVTASRISRRASTDELGGTTVPCDVEASIRSSGAGAPLPATLRRSMETGFGADFGGVRVHADSGAAVALQAEAFTLGDEIHVAPGRYDPESPGGQELLAHELTHVVQQGGGTAQRRIQRRLWDQATFDTKTSEGWLTRKSLAQEEIRKVIEDFHNTLGATIPDAQIPRALALVAQMQEMARAWVVSHTDDDGNTDASRSNRMIGITSFITHLNGEAATLQQRFAASQATAPAGAQGGDPTAALGLAVEGATTEADRAKTKKVTDHYEGTATSAFRHLGRVIDLAAPTPGDETKIELQVAVPLDPTASLSLGMNFMTEVERGDNNVRLRVQLGVVVKGSIAGAASISAELGGYFEAQAATGADAAELISYELYRRARESKVFPHDAASYMWGGRGGGSGERSAEKWSLDMEKRLFGVLDGVPALSDFGGDWGQFAAARDGWIAANQDKLDELLETYVESGAYLTGKAEAGIEGIVALEGSVTGTLGRRIDMLSLLNRKGGAGEANLSSDSAMNLTGRAEKNVGRTVKGFVVEVKAGAGPLEGAGKFKGTWLSDGKSASEGSSESDFDWEFELEAGGKMPLNELVLGGAGSYIAGLVASAGKAIRAGAAKGMNSDQDRGAAASGAENAIIALSGIARIPQEEWKPELAPEADPELGAVKGEGNIGLKVKFAASSNGVEVTVSIVKETSISVAGYFKAAIEKSERLLGFKVDGSGATAI